MNIEFERQDSPHFKPGEWRYVGRMSQSDRWSHISILRRLTGFGWFETESALMPRDRSQRMPLIGGDARGAVAAAETERDVELIFLHNDGSTSGAMMIDSLIESCKESEADND